MDKIIRKGETAMKELDRRILENPPKPEPQPEKPKPKTKEEKLIEEYLAEYDDDLETIESVKYAFFDCPVRGRIRGWEVKRKQKPMSKEEFMVGIVKGWIKEQERERRGSDSCI